MTDKISPQQRSRVMAAVRAKNTGPEMIVRRLAHSCGYRFRLHRKDLPGSPDLVFRRLRAIVFVHGCFWHQHDGCRRARRPAANSDYWELKLERNMERDAAALAQLDAAGWRVLTLWECELSDSAAVRGKLISFLGLPAGRGLDD